MTVRSRDDSMTGRPIDSETVSDIVQAVKVLLRRKAGS